MALRLASKLAANRAAVCRGIKRGFRASAANQAQLALTVGMKRGLGNVSWAFQNHKYKMNTAVGFAVSVLGDTLAQQSERLMLPEEQRKAQNWKRTLSVGAFGAVVYGAVITRWYVMLERILGPCTGVGKVLLLKIMADEFILGPCFNGGYLAFHAWFSEEDIKQSLCQNFVPTMMADFLIWPPAMYFGFLKVSSAARPAYVATVGVLWNGILSYMGRRDVAQEQEESVGVMDQLEDKFSEILDQGAQTITPLTRSMSLSDAQLARAPA